MTARCITSALWRQPAWARLSHGARLLLLGLATETDGDGCVPASLRWMHGAVFGLDELVTIDQVRAWLVELHGAQLVRRDGDRVALVPILGLAIAHATVVRGQRRDSISDEMRPRTPEALLAWKDPADGGKCLADVWGWRFSALDGKNGRPSLPERVAALWPYVEDKHWPTQAVAWLASTLARDNLTFKKAKEAEGSGGRPINDDDVRLRARDLHARLLRHYEAHNRADECPTRQEWFEQHRDDIECGRPLVLPALTIKRDDEDEQAARQALAAMRSKWSKRGQA